MQEAAGLSLDQRLAMMHSDPIFRAFLERQAEEGRALAQASDILDLECLPTGQHLIAHYTCRGLVKDRDGMVREAAGFHVGVFFAADYLRSVNPVETLTLFDPLNTYHPNVAFGAPFICVGRIAPGMPLADLLYQVYETAVGSEVACPKQEGDGQAIPGGLTEALKEAGWEYHERPGGTLLADLGTGSRFLQAEVEQCGVGTRFRVTLYRHESAGDAAQQVLSLYLLEANAALRYARAFLRREADGIAAGFEVRTESAPSPTEAGHALAALSVAGRECAREMEVLKDGVVAGIYRSARLPFHPQRKGA